MSKDIQITISKKTFYTFLLLGILALAAVGINATSHPSPGHTILEIGNACISSGLNCNFLGAYYTKAEVDVICATPPVPVPNAPSGLTATFIGNTQVRLTWNDNSNDETLFNLERDDLQGDGWDPVGPIGNDIELFDDFDIDTSIPVYNYRISACNSGGCSSFSNTASTGGGS